MTRQALLSVSRLAIAGVLFLAACAPAAPAPAPEPAKPAAPAAAPAAPAAPAASASKVAPPADWQAQWDKLLAAARQEGKVNVKNAPGEGFRSWILPFEQAFPGIKIEQTNVQGGEFFSRILAERRAGQYLWDIDIGGPGGQRPAIPEGVYDPVKPALFLPDVLDDSKWLSGFDFGFSDKTGFVYMMPATEPSSSVWVNRDLLPESEFNSENQLIDPKWKGKIAIHDPRGSGTGQEPAAKWLLEKGEPFLRQLLSQDVGITGDYRQLSEWAVRGKYPIVIGIVPTVHQDFTKEGVGLNVKRLPADPNNTWLSMGYSITLINRAPHPNAAKVFLNWALTKNAQASYAKLNKTNSRRLDVEPGDPAILPDPKKQYTRSTHKEEIDPAYQRVVAIAKEIIK